MASFALLVGAGAPLAAAPAHVHFDIFGEVTGCGGVNLCGDFGSSLDSAGDVNGDGVLDLAVGAPSVSGANPSSGRVYLFFGPFDGQDFQAADADVTITGLEFGDGVGQPRGGDLNGDGLSDLVIGAAGPDVDGGTLNGQVYVFYGPLAGDLLASDADATITGVSFSQLGISLAIGDFNDDGTDDLLAGASQVGSGTAHLFYGPVVGELGAFEADAVVSGTLQFEELGRSVAAVDLNDDGFDDAIVGAPNFPLVDLGTGAVFVFFGPLVGSHVSTGADVTITGEQINDGFGSHLANAGDLDGDGVDDLAVGAWQLFVDGETGKAYVFHGPLESGAVAAADADAILTGESSGPFEDNFGNVAIPGDVNGDGRDDLLVGAGFGGPASRGRAYLFHGPVSGAISAATADAMFDAPGMDPAQGGDWLGRGVGVPGDLDGNGLDDLLLGAPGSEGPGFTRVVLSNSLIFTDGFESGDTSAWSGTVP